jgi:ribokinase
MLEDYRQPSTHPERSATISTPIKEPSPKSMTDPTPAPNITVIGSLNVDTILAVPLLPKPGETVSATAQETRYGGKGANQALAAARQGGVVSLIGCVGNDARGSAYIQYLIGENINIAPVMAFDGYRTGSAIITINPQGQNQIVSVPGANALLGADIVAGNNEVLDNADVVICQFEAPEAAVLYALEEAARAGRTTILNPSPTMDDYPWGDLPVDFLIVNEQEAEDLLGFVVQDTSDAAAIREQLPELGAGTIIVTRGADPTIAVSAKQVFKVPPPAVTPVDTTGAGDAFTGAFAVHWAQTHDLLSSIRKANIAGALTTQGIGAQDSMPTREMVDGFVLKPLS